MITTVLKSHTIFIDSVPPGIIPFPQPSKPKKKKKKRKPRDVEELEDDGPVELSPEELSTLALEGLENLKFQEREALIQDLRAQLLTVAQLENELAYNAELARLNAIKAEHTRILQAELAIRAAQEEEEQVVMLLLALGEI